MAAGPPGSGSGMALAGLGLLLLLGPAVRGLSEEGRWTRTTDSTQTNEFEFHKTMFNGTLVSLKFSCSREVNLTVVWYLRSSRCQNEIRNETQPNVYLQFYNVQLSDEDKGQYIFHTARLEKCSPHMNANPEMLKFSDRPYPLNPTPTEAQTGTKESKNIEKPSEKEIPQEPAKAGGKSNQPKEKPKDKANDPKVKPEPQKTKRSAEKPAVQEPAQKGSPKEVSLPEQPGGKLAVKVTAVKASEQKEAEDFCVTNTWEDGPYVFIVKISSVDPEPKPWQSTIDVSMWHPVHQFTSASEWPLMMFYMVMVIVYVLYGVLWLVLLICYWRDILRIQYWIGGIVLLGLLEKVVFYAEFQSIQTYGVSVQGAVIFAEILCSVKRMLARVLVVIASLGYGIVKPRLGVLLNRVLGVGMLYLFFSIIEGILRVKSSSQEQNGIASLTCEFALAFVDSCIVLWIFMSLVQTMKLLRVRRNLVKLSLYRHFTNTLVFAVIASVIFILWSSKTFQLTRCQSDWREVWLNDAFWRFLFSIILLVIMFLWRPSANNQRYAFVPLIDAGSEEEDDDEDQMPNEGFAEGMKMRGTKNEPNGILKGSRVDEDLKWVEENIPSSMADVVLPPLLDSDEEILTTKFEMSKME